jgi:folate-binding protein YgfZ
MNEQWKTFLEGQGATFDEQGIASWDWGGLPQSGLCDLSHLGLVRVSGEDAEAFLQGQLTNDVKGVDGEHWSPGAYCSPKGRMIADFRTTRLGEDYLLQMPMETQALIMKRLPMFVLMSKAKVTDASDQLASFGCWGEDASTALQAAVGNLPTTAGESVQLEAGVLLRLAGDLPRLLVIGEPAMLEGLWQGVAASAQACGIDGWRLHQIRAGCPTVYGATSEAFVAQMCNLQRINGISFTKGCFVGQEVVARMKYLGKLKRQMYVARADTDQRPEPGDKLHSATSKSGQGAGTVVDAAPSPDGGFELLVVAEIAAAEGDGLHLQAADGPKLALSPPPYGFDE